MPAPPGGTYQAVGLEVFEIAHRVPSLAVGKIRGIGGAASRGLARVDLDQAPLVEELRQLTVEARVDGKADQVLTFGDRVQRLSHLDVAVTVDLRLGVDREVVNRRRRRQEPGQLLQPEDLHRPPLGGAVDTLARLLEAPPHHVSLGVFEPVELLSTKAGLPDVRHDPLHPRLVSRRSHPRRVNHEPTTLGVLLKGGVEPRINVVGHVHDRLQIIRVLCPTRLCGRSGRQTAISNWETAVGRHLGPHNAVA